MTLKTILDVTITTLTPLHIGNGQELRRDFDYVTHQGQTWVLNADAFLAHLQRPDGSFDERILGRPAAELLESKDFRRDSGFFRYVLPGQPRSQGYGAVLRVQYKDAFDKPYIPGSSLKGALRTILAWHGFQARGMRLDVNDLRGSRSWAGQGLEREIFGKNPNYDLLRAMQVADSASQNADRLQIINAQVFTGSEKTGAPIELEAVRNDTVFKTTIILDDFLHGDMAERELRFGNRWQWLEELPAIAQHYGREIVAEEIAWYRARNYTNVATFYQRLLNVLEQGKLGKNSFLLQIGWGGGWPSKTIGKPLQADKRAWEELLGNKRLSPARFRRQRGDVFPKSRRAVAVKDQPAAPMGWCLVELKKREE